MHSYNDTGETMSTRAIQDCYPDEFKHCYGCGTLNTRGLAIQSYWDGSECRCTFTPEPYHTAFPGFVYGGLIASVIDCHSTATAAAAACARDGINLDASPPIRYVTACLHVDYLKPTPIKGPLELRSTVKEIQGKKVIVTTNLYASGRLCARGEVVAVSIPESMIPGA
jgi:acyl-coenzyme A thioesterase PaaI-like protein